MKVVLTLIKRNIKLFFKDKGMFLTALITPAILLVLYATFLSNVYRDSFTMNFPQGIPVPEDIIDGLVGGQLISSLLAVSCITVAFCSNFLMVQDRANGTIKDLRIAPISTSVLSLSYYVATLISTLLICFTATVICLVYVAAIGWYMSALDVLLLFLDVIILVFFGTALSSLINFFLSTQGQISAVGTIISAGYGFICGAYMPISSFSDGLQKVISFLPGTYGTSLFRNHAMDGALKALGEEGIPNEVIDGLRDAVDCNIYFFDTKVEPYVMYIVLFVSIALLVGGYILLNVFRKKDK
ncbi:MAG: ABC transporter permease [Clostridia bacterium]|nr:ABC transporter permease [Clostridia bacterium]